MDAIACVIPHNVEAEESVIAAAIIDASLLNTIPLKPDDFYVTRNQWIWDAMLDLNRKGHGVDFVTLTDILDKRGRLDEIGGPAYLTKLISNSLYITSGAASHARIVRDAAHRRRMLQVANDIARAAYMLDEDPTAAVNAAIAALALDATSGKGAQHIKGAISRLYDDIEKRVNDPRDVWGIPSGFHDLDLYTGGWQPGEVVYIAGEPGAGKTKMVLQMVTNAAMKEFGSNPVVIYSLEMAELALMRRMVSNLSDVRTRALKTGKLNDDDWPALTNAIELAESLPIYLCDDSNMSTLDLRSDIARLVQCHGVRLVMVDYLYLLSGYERITKDYERTAAISRDLKSIARTFGISLLVINSVVKEGMDNTTAAPVKSNMKGGGQVIHDGDLIAFIQNVKGAVGIVQLLFTKVRDIDIGLRAFEFEAVRDRPYFKPVQTRTVDLNGAANQYWQK